jgi:hypothetical protein
VKHVQGKAYGSIVEVYQGTQPELNYDPTEQNKQRYHPKGQDTVNRAPTHMAYGRKHKHSSPYEAHRAYFAVKEKERAKKGKRPQSRAAGAGIE